MMCSVRAGNSGMGRGLLTDVWEELKLALGDVKRLNSENAKLLDEKKENTAEIKRLSNQLQLAELTNKELRVKNGQLESAAAKKPQQCPLDAGLLPLEDALTKMNEEVSRLNIELSQEREALRRANTEIQRLQLSQQEAPPPSSSSAGQKQDRPPHTFEVGDEEKGDQNDCSEMALMKHAFEKLQMMFLAKNEALEALSLKYQQMQSHDGAILAKLEGSVISMADSLSKVAFGGK